MYQAQPTVTLYNTIGQGFEISPILDGNRAEVNLPTGIAPGIYLIQIQVGTQTIQKKIKIIRS